MTCDSGVVFLLIAVLVIAGANWWYWFHEAKTLAKQVEGLERRVREAQA